ncbi:uncharacterized protein LOC133500464 [Syngnathoides biaculeatus]|uniref:uncharacterized protein LOC133500464 n=1 Tax=Syngnathoides biaculeatus TaxID=300417 RepID=UPI002ADE44C2|nr:uncharacterized protein LOC133500464 [Syngnathoides biaculeatus]
MNRATRPLAHPDLIGDKKCISRPGLLTAFISKAQQTKLSNSACRWTAELRGLDAIYVADGTHSNRGWSSLIVNSLGSSYCIWFIPQPDRHHVRKTCPLIMACMLWTVFMWTFKGVLCTCRFLWICPYNAIQFLPRERHTVEKSSPQKQSTGCESKMAAAIPGCPDRTAALQKRLSKTEQDILSLRTRIACERAAWERKFAELQRQQEALCNQVIFEVGAPIRAEQKVDNGDIFGECSSKEHRLHDIGADVLSRQSPFSLSPAPSFSSYSSCSSASSVRSTRSVGPQRVFVPHSPMDLHLGHRVRIMLPSGRISTGVIRFLGHLQGESELHLGVELQTPDHGMRDGHHKGHFYFDCKPGHGAFVPFHKLLMAWE